MAAGATRQAFGIAVAMESTGLISHESAKVRIDSKGHVLVYSGLTSHGQGQVTTLARVCADALGVDLAAVTVRLGDTQLLAFGNGTFARRGAVVGANAVNGAAVRLRERILDYAASQLQADGLKLKLKGGRILRKDETETLLALYRPVSSALRPIL